MKPFRFVLKEKEYYFKMLEFICFDTFNDNLDYN